jgi:SAM-dependent MidA family methyltransferase
MSERSERDALGERIRQRIEREGPITFAAYMEAALYDPDDGFFATGRGAGRRGGDFVTSVEVGSLFGEMVARALEGWWDRLGRPDPFVVVEAGAGRGQLARDVLRAAPAFAPALRYVLVERSAALLAEHHRHLPWEPPEDVLGAYLSGDDDEPASVAPGQGPIVTSLPELPAVALTGVVVANELLDNLPCRLVERTASGWDEVRLGLTGEVLVPADPELAARADQMVGDRPDPVPVTGVRLPVPTGVAEWLRDVRRVVRRGGLLVVDYVVPVRELVARGPTGWLRTYRGHARGGSAWEDPGSQDITIDVPEEAVLRMAAATGWALDGPPRTQAAWLDELGLPARVAAARADWDARAHVGDLDALRARSVVSEAAALTDPTGLGAHWVATFHTR